MHTRTDLLDGAIVSVRSGDSRQVVQQNLYRFRLTGSALPAHQDTLGGVFSRQEYTDDKTPKINEGWCYRCRAESLLYSSRLGDDTSAVKVLHVESRLFLYVAQRT